MGAKLLLHVQLPRGVAPSPGQSEVLARLLSDLCVQPIAPTGRGNPDSFLVTCQQVKQGDKVDAGRPAGLMKDQWLVTFRDAPETVYLLNRPDHQVLEADAAMTALLEKKLGYRPTMTIRFEGKSYSKGDFIFRPGQASGAGTLVGARFLGHCLEVEYLAAAHASVAGPMVAQLLDVLRQHLGAMAERGDAGALGIAGFEPIRPSYDKYPMPTSAYGRAHAAVAYADLAVHLLTVGES